LADFKTATTRLKPPLDSSSSSAACTAERPLARGSRADSSSASKRSRAGTDTRGRSNLRFQAVFTFRCTQKLLDRLKAVPVPQAVSPDTILGDWYANLVRAGRVQVVLAVSERTLLPVVVPAKDGRTLVERFTEALEPVLASVGVPADAVITERGAMQHWAIGKTANRRILGSLNDLVFQLQVGLVNFPDRPLLAHSLWLAQTPLKVIEYGAPDRATVAAFAAHRALGAARSR
jgi:hypothetical protein